MKQWPGAGQLCPQDVDRCFWATLLEAVTIPYYLHSSSALESHTCAILQRLGLSVGAADTMWVQRLCVVVCARAARLCAAALAAVLSRLQHSREQPGLQLSVAIGGRVFEQLPR